MLDIDTGPPMCIISSNLPPVTVNGEFLDSMDEFTNLDSVISKENVPKKDFQSRLGEARGAFARLQLIWKSEQYSLQTKLRLYNSNVGSLLLYQSECWRVVKADKNKRRAFHNGCLREICRIFWTQKVSNEYLC